ncbi:MAG: hypothetical protein GVY07_09705 [Bacteroidetes bacterium]|nr:hypothetical protein [Bacteroidota bacterium]
MGKVHWGGSWRYAIPCSQQEFAHQLSEIAGIDLVYSYFSIISSI